MCDLSCILGAKLERLYHELNEKVLFEEYFYFASVNVFSQFLGNFPYKMYFYTKYYTIPRVFRNRIFSYRIL